MFFKKQVLLWSSILIFQCVQSQKNDTPVDTLPELKHITTPVLSIFDSPLMVPQRSAVAHTSISYKEIQKLNNGQDMTYILHYTPSLVATSDAGTGIGYTGLWIRGSDPSRINVTINNVPLNDAESQQVFWVNLPDLASSAQFIQIQRGAGPSTAGPGAFGGSIHINTIDQSIQAPSKISYQTTAGSFNTFKRTLQLDRIRLPFQWVFSGRASEITSDGYIDRAHANLKGYQASMQRNGQSKWGNWKALLTSFGGNERTYQAWNGSPHEIVFGASKEDLLNYAARNYLTEAEIQNLLNSGRTYNYFTYPNQVDQYQQHHQQAHFQWSKNNWLWQSALFHTRGAGYYEEQKLGAETYQYGLDSILTSSNGQLQWTQQMDAVRRRWLDNHLKGFSSFIQRARSDQHKVVIGMSTMQYQGKHSGELISIAPTPQYDYSTPYYAGTSNKSDFNTYVQYHFTGEKLQWMADLQYRNVSYKSQGTTNDLAQYQFQDQLHFVNPKMGATYQINTHHQLAAFMAHLGKEPNRNDYVDHATKPLPEFMTDYELSWKWNPIKKYKTPDANGIQKITVAFNTNLFWMQYKNQLVLTGALNDVGAPLRTNIPVSFRRGIEWEGHFVFENNISHLSFHSNLTWSQNQIQNFKETLYDYTNDGFAVEEINHSATAIAFSPQWISGNTLEYIYKNHWGISTQFKWVSKQYLDNTQDENKIISAYHVNDWKIFYQWQQNDNRFEWSLWINNAGNQMYNSNGWTYSYLYGNKVNERFYYPQAGRNYLISLKIEI